MHLTKFTDYALRTLMYLALQPERLVTIAELARTYGVPANHLMKIVRRLAQGGLIETVRGKGGGMRLARSAASIRVGDVVRETEENMDLAECFHPAKRSCPMLPQCALQSALSTAGERFLETLNDYSLADLVAGRSAPTGPTVAPLKQRSVGQKPEKRGSIKAN